SHTEQMSNHRFQEYLASLRPCLSPGPTGKKAQSPNWNSDPADSALRPATRGKTKEMKGDDREVGWQPERKKWAYKAEVFKMQPRDQHKPQVSLST
ncbi:hypothetical protein KUCAC02_017904, partial [Chaenocephalus aceratus]